MIDAAKLLGGLLNGSLNSSIGNPGSPGTGILPGKAAIGMGIIGVAIAAFEHYSEQNKAGRQDAPYPEPSRSPGSNAPPPPPGASPGVPPGPPLAGAGAPPPPPPPPSRTPSSPHGQVDPVLLLRAMVAAANADGFLDDAERGRIFSHLERAGLSDEEREFLRQELDAPRPLNEIAASATSRADAEQIYAVSLLAVEVDTDEERAYLEELRRALGIYPVEADAIARSIGR
jgi:uncharacterized membrane protein YebE (DUF533 family)